MKKVILVIVIMFSIAALSVILLLPEPKNKENNIANHSKKIIGTNGVTFNTISTFDWKDAGSTSGNYSNIILNSTRGDSPSSIEVSIPLREASNPTTLLDLLSGRVDTSGIKPTMVNGHSGSTISYPLDTRQDNTDIPWEGQVIKELYKSTYNNSPIILTYMKGKGDTSLDTAWEDLRSSISW